MAHYALDQMLQKRFTFVNCSALPDTGRMDLHYVLSNTNQNADLLGTAGDIVYTIADNFNCIGS